MAGTGDASSGIVHEVLRKDNYGNWSVLVRNYLLGRDLWDVVASASEIDVKSKDKYNKIWRRENAKALHIIQLSCGSEILDQIKRFDTAKEAWNHLNASFGRDLKASPDVEQGVMDDTNKWLHRYVEDNDWKAARSFINDNEMAIFSTSSSGRTVLHVAVIAGHENMVVNLMRLGKDKLVKMQDHRRYTALALAAELTGNTNIAKCMVEREGGQDLLIMKTNEGEIPVLLAAAKGHKQMTRYLYSKTSLDLVQNNDQNDVLLLLTRCIIAEIFDVALRLLHQPNEIPLTHESDGLRPLNALVHMPSAFPSGSRFGCLQLLIYNIIRPDLKQQDLYGNTAGTVLHVAQDKGPHKNSLAGRFCGPLSNFQPARLLGRKFGFLRAFDQNSVIVKFSGQLSRFARMFVPSSILLSRLFGFVHEFILKLSGIGEIYDKKRTHHIVDQILRCLVQRISTFSESQLREASAYDAMLQAAKYGIIEFIDSMRKANPDLLWVIDRNKRGVFSHAILNRRQNVFQLMHRVNGRKEIIISHADAFGNNLLHLAGHLGPSSDLDSRSGAALQMQREIQWFKAVEGIVHPKCREAKNADGKKPGEIFTEHHKELVKAGEKWAKDTASSFTLVGTLIITIMFAAAFTVPGGNNQETGIPIFLHGKVFTVFIIADAVSLFASSTSVLVFIGIITSRYAEKDFLKTLPLKLLFGLVTLFLSVVSMMVAFCAALGMMLRGYQHLIIVAMSLASIPVMVFVPSQLRLFLEIFNSTIRSNVFSSIKKENNWYY